MPGILKLLEVNRKTCIKIRELIGLFGQPLWENRTSQPIIEQTNDFYRGYATQLAVRTCRKAIKEWGGQLNEVTHTVAVTYTNADSPGFDLEIVNQLDLSLDVERTLFHKIGCAGGLAALRIATQMTRASCDRPANILVFAFEISSGQVIVELEDTEYNE